MYYYETHLHTAPVSKCAVATVRETLEFYKRLGYDGVFITNHFVDGNINLSHGKSLEEKLDFYFSDYEEGVKIGKEIGIKVFLGVESSYHGTDFLLFGLDKEWFLEHREWYGMEDKSRQLEIFAENGAFIIQAHPYREADYIDHIRLFPRKVEGAEVINSSNTDFMNGMADAYADAYGLLKSAGSDNHVGSRVKRLAGIQTDKPINSVYDFIDMMRRGEASVFLKDNPEYKSRSCINIL